MLVSTAFFTDEEKDRLHEKMLAKCEVDANTDCWIWTGAWDSRGYGRVRFGDHLYRVHRLAILIYTQVQAIDNSVTVFHDSRVCKSRACFNPDHLRMGSKAEAMVGWWLGCRRTTPKRSFPGWRAAMG